MSIRFASWYSWSRCAWSVGLALGLVEDLLHRGGLLRNLSSPNCGLSDWKNVPMKLSGSP